MTRGSRPDSNRKVQTEAPLIEYLVAHMGKVVTLKGIMEAMPDGALESSVRGAIRRLINSDRMDIEVVAQGNAWRPRRGPDSSDEPWSEVDVKPVRTRAKVDADVLGPFTSVGRTQDGSRVVSGPDGRLYSLKAL